MTLIVAWSDPFWLVADSLALSKKMFAPEPLPSPAEKIRVISSGLAVGLAGPGDDFDGVFAGVSADPRTDWSSLKVATQRIVGNINAPPRYDRFKVSIVIAGTVGGKRDMLACGPLSGMSDADTVEGPSFAWAGTGGSEANSALAKAKRSHTDVTGEDLLGTIVDEAIQADPNSGYPVYRIDLAGAETKLELWLSGPRDVLRQRGT